MRSSNPRTNGNAPPEGTRRPDPYLCPFWLSDSGPAEACVSAIPSSVTWTQVSGLQPLVEPCLKQALKCLPRPDVWTALGPVPSACLLFLSAYYQAWSRQVSAAGLPCLQPPRPPVWPSPLLCRHLSLSGAWVGMCHVVGTEWKAGTRASGVLGSCSSPEPASPFLLFLSLPFCFPGTLLMGPETPEQQLSLCLFFSCSPRCCVLEQAQGCLSFRKVGLWPLA